MGRTFSPTITSAPVIVDPDESHDEYPHYSRWSYENAWDPDSDAFFKDAVYEAVVPALPLEPITPVESSDGSSVDSSGRGTPAGELPPVPGQISPSNQEMELWLNGASTGNNATAAASLPPLPTPRRHSTSELRRGAPLPHFVSSAAFERFYTRQLNRARDSQRFPALPTDGEPDADGPPVSSRPVPGVSVSVRTSEISPIQLPSSQSRAAIALALLQQQQQQQQQQHPTPARPHTPPPASTPSSVTVTVISTPTPGGEALQLSPPPSVSPRIYNWTAAVQSGPESPTLPSRIRVTPARWPVY